MLVIAFLLAFLSIRNYSFFGDEGAHFAQLSLYQSGQYGRVHESLTMLPGYHVVLGLLSALAGIHTLNFYRLVNIGFSLLSVAVFSKVLSIVHPKAGVARIAQYAFLPILFPYFFLLYTDAFSLLIVLLAFWALLRGRYAAAGIAGIASMAVRQNNVVWLLFFFLAFLWIELPGFLSMIPPRLRNDRVRTFIAAHPTRVTSWTLLGGTAIFVLGFGLFVAFVVWNGGVAIGDKDKHPFPSFHLGNVYFCLFVAFFMFLPLHLANVRLIAGRLRSSRLLLPALVAFFLVYMLTFSNDHVYNQGLDSLFIHNRILAYFNQTLTLKALFFLPVACSFLSFAVTPLVRPFGVLLVPITVLYLLPSWLIEHRYYLIPFTLFLLLRMERSAWLENLSAAYSVVCAILLFTPVAMRWLLL
jgi:alpha-1,2-glucosyltransferase